MTTTLHGVQRVPYYKTVTHPISGISQHLLAKWHKHDFVLHLGDIKAGRLSETRKKCGEIHLNAALRTPTQIQVNQPINLANEWKQTWRIRRQSHQWRAAPFAYPTQGPLFWQFLPPTRSGQDRWVKHGKPQGPSVSSTTLQ